MKRYSQISFGYETIDNCYLSYFTYDFYCLGDFSCSLVYLFILNLF